MGDRVKRLDREDSQVGTLSLFVGGQKQQCELVEDSGGICFLLVKSYMSNHQDGTCTVQRLLIRSGMSFIA